MPDLTLGEGLGRAGRDATLSTIPSSRLLPKRAFLKKIVVFGIMTLFLLVLLLLTSSEAGEVSAVPLSHPEKQVSAKKPSSASQNSPKSPISSSIQGSKDVSSVPETLTKPVFRPDVNSSVSSENDIKSVGFGHFKLSDLHPLYFGNISYTAARTYLQVARPVQQKRYLVTGGAGFVGSHLVDRLMLQGHYVIVLDNLFTGSKRNIEHWLGHPNFEFVRHDVVDPYMAEVDYIYHLACPASPPHYQFNPIKTIKTSVMGTINMLGLAKRVRARFLLTSTSEVYGDPQEHPQKETYWGHVNPIGPRACYDEGKRVAETLSISYQAQGEVDIRIARIFNTYGPRMNIYDGRVVSNFIIQALQGKDLTIYGDGKQTRSFQFIHDLVDGLMALMESNYSLPINIGNPQERTIGEFAKLIRDKINPAGKIAHLPATKDDPQRRKPDISLAKKELDWEPRFTLDQGIAETVEYFKRALGQASQVSDDL